MSPDAATWIQRLNLLPHPEGGYFRETYRATETIAAAHLPQRYSCDRSFATAIYFLLESHQFSALHRLRSDEMWHYYTGSPLTVYTLDPQGQLAELHLGHDWEEGQVYQAVVPQGHWFGAAVTTPNSYALVGCTVAPGFDFADFELANQEQLVRTYPQHRTIIQRLTAHSS